MSRQAYTPRPYQNLITGHMVEHQRCAIWAGMGLGKSVSTLTALDSLFLAGEDAPALVLAPKRVALTTWPEECRKWSHLRQVNVMPIVGSEKERIAALKRDVPVFSCNYDNLVWLTDYFGERWPFKTIIADESTKLKSFRLKQGGKRAQALSRVAHAKASRFIELTGTPASNGLLDLWGQMWFVDGGKRLGRTYSAFKERWFQQSFDSYGSVALPHAQAEIHEALRDICLTIDAKDWFDLDDPIVNNIYVDLPIKARQSYNDMERQMFMAVEGHEIEAFNAASKTQKLLQLSSGAVYVDPTADCDSHPKSRAWKEVHDEKLQALEDIIEESAGAPVLVAYHFKSDLARLLRAFPNGRELDDDPSTITDWNAGRIPVLFAHPRSAGHGLNLQDGGNTLVFFTHDWNLEERLQIIERIGPTRQKQAGHNRPVFIHNIIARDTVDEMVMERVETKREVQDVLLAAMKRRN